MIKVKMVPNLAKFDKEESGVKRVVEAYTRYLPQFDVQLVDEGHDVLAVHAGTTNKFDAGIPLVAILHGLYWTADFSADMWLYHTNAAVIASIRAAKIVTVPSDWVAETLRRDMRLDPVILHHGIDWQDWQSDQENEGYVLFNKNRNADACDPAPVGQLASQFPDVDFVTTFAPQGDYPNVMETGVVPGETMKRMVQSASVYLASTKETFSIGVLEAMAAGVPVLSSNHGHAPVLAPHGVCGYAYRPGDAQDMAEGLRYCLKHRKILSDNARERAKDFPWDKAVEKVADTFKQAAERDERPYRI